MTITKSPATKKTRCTKITRNGSRCKRSTYNGLSCTNDQQEGSSVTEFCYHHRAPTSPQRKSDASAPKAEVEVDATCIAEPTPVQPAVGQESEGECPICYASGGQWYCRIRGRSRSRAPKLPGTKDEMFTWCSNGHSFCIGCIEEVSKVAFDNCSIATCPICRVECTHILKGDNRNKQGIPAVGSLLEARNNLHRVVHEMRTPIPMVTDNFKKCINEGISKLENGSWRLTRDDHDLIAEAKKKLTRRQTFIPLFGRNAGTFVFGGNTQFQNFLSMALSGLLVVISLEEA
eukprot:GFYU01000271.1.p1 GENE.GFYU01000271.1~~GFYU01000271.1.p1  ORF type:complete len:289 (+),score=36.91 GFYU01000271.1:148-1014(+)